MAKILKSASFNPEPVTAGGKQHGTNGTSPPVDAATPPALPIVDPQAEAERLIETARTEAAALLARAEAEAEQIRQKARQAGLHSGYEDGKKAAEAEAVATITDIKRIAMAISTEQNAILHEAQQHLGALALAIAKKILGHSLTVQPEVITDMVADVIDAASIHGACFVHVHPEDYKLLQPHWDAVSHLQQPDSSWELVSDNRVSRGGCMIDVEGGTIDARVQTKLAKIEAALNKAIE